MSLYLYGSQTNLLKGSTRIIQNSFPEIDLRMDGFDSGDAAIDSDNSNNAKNVFVFSIENRFDSELFVRVRLHQALANEFVAGRGSPISLEKLNFNLFSDEVISNLPIQTKTNARNNQLEFEINVPPNDTTHYVVSAYLKQISSPDQNNKVVRLSFKQADDIACTNQHVGGQQCVVVDSDYVGDSGPDVWVKVPVQNNNNESPFARGVDLRSPANIALERNDTLTVAITRPAIQALAQEIPASQVLTEILKVGINPSADVDLDGVRLKLITESNTARSFLENRLKVFMYLLDKNGRESKLYDEPQYFGSGNVGFTREKMFSFSNVNLKSTRQGQSDTCPCTLSVRVMHSNGTNQRFKIEANNYHFSGNPQPTFEGITTVQGNFFTLVAEAQEVGAGAAGGARGGAIGGLGSVGAFGSSGVLPDEAAVGVRPNAGGGNGGASVGANGVNVNFPGSNLGGDIQIKTPAVGPNVQKIGNWGRTVQDAAARAAAERTRLAQEQAAREEAARQQAERDRLAREQSAREQAARDEAARQQALADEAARALAAAQQARDLAAQQQAAAEMAAAQEARNRALAAQAEYERQVAALNAASEYAAQQQRAAEEAQKAQAANQQTAPQTAGQQNETPAHTAAAAASDGTTDRVASGSTAAQTSLGQPNLEYSARLAYAPERGSTGPAANLYFLIAGLSPAMVALYRKMRK